MDTTQETRYHREVRATLDQVVELLDKQALVKELSSKQATHQQGLVETLVVRQQAAQIERRIEQLHPADLAFLIEGLPPARRTTIWDLVGRERRGAVLIELSDAVRGSLFAEMQESEIIGAVEHLASDDIADLVPSLPPDVVLALLRALDGKDRTEVQTVLSFPPGSVGSLMELDVPSIHGDVQVDVALRQIRRRGGLPERMDQIFVVDRTGALIGALPLRNLLIHEPEVAVGAIMTPEPLSFYTHDSANDAVQSFERYDLITAPVVNLHRQLVGVLTVDAVMDQLHEAVQRERLKQVGLREDEDLFAPIWKSGRNRWAWLAINLVAALVASRVIGAFEGTHRQACGARRAHADHRERRGQHRQPDRGPRDPRAGARSDRPRQSIALPPQGARDRARRRAPGAAVTKGTRPLGPFLA